MLSEEPYQNSLASQDTLVTGPLRCSRQYAFAAFVNCLTPTRPRHGAPWLRGGGSLDRVHRLLSFSTVAGVRCPQALLAYKQLGRNCTQAVQVSTLREEASVVGRELVGNATG